MIETTAAMAIVAVCFCAVLIQSMAGFGSAMLAMGILTPLVGLEVSGPLVALVALTLEAGMLVTLRSKLSVAELAPLILGSFVAIPIGVWVTVFLDEDVALAIIGWLIFAYVACATFGRAPKITGGRALPCGAGLTAGLLGGAYNISGPPMVVYGSLRGWDAAGFKGNLQAYFFVTDAFIVATHLWRGNVTGAIWQVYAFTIPAIGLAFWLGMRVSRRIPERTFRRLTMALLTLIALRLIAGA